MRVRLVRVCMQIDEDFRVYLIEVNTNPFLGYQNPWHARLVRRMIEDMTQISIDTVFTPPPGAKVAQHPDLKPDEDGNVPRVSMVDDLSNGFELMCVSRGGVIGLHVEAPCQPGSLWVLTLCARARA